MSERAICPTCKRPMAVAMGSKQTILEALTKPILNAKRRSIFRSKWPNEWYIEFGRELSNSGPFRHADVMSLVDDGWLEPTYPDATATYRLKADAMPHGVE